MTEHLEIWVLSKYYDNIICDVYERRPLPEKYTAD